MGPLILTFRWLFKINKPPFRHDRAQTPPQAARSPTRPKQFLALGVANVGTGLFQGFPVSSSGSRTAIGETAGSKTQLHSLVVVGCVVLVLLLLGPALAHFPLAALGAIVIYAATRLVDVPGLRPPRELPAQRTDPRAGHLGGRARVRHSQRHPDRGRGVRGGDAAPDRPPARRGAGPGGRAGRDARRRRLPGTCS